MLKSPRDAMDSGSERAERAMHHATDATASATKSAGDQRAAEYSERGREQWDKGRARAEESLDQVFDYVRSNPGKSLAMAVAGGWLLGGNLLRRRR